MITVKLTGGLGNQMFQYAMGRALAHSNKDVLYLDNYWFLNMRGNTPRVYGLGCFNIVENFVNNFSKRNSWFRRFQRIISRLPFLDKHYIKEKNIFQFDLELLKKISKISGNIYLEGYWQNEKYFKDIEKIIRQEFTLKNNSTAIGEKIREQIGENNSISLHIRRGDYVSDKVYNKVYGGVCSAEYYQKAVQHIREKVSVPYFFIFTDDPQWAEKNIENLGINKSNSSIISGRGFHDCEELILMSWCKHNIIANSSFSWWGAWLNNNPNKIVIAPSRWSNAGNISIDTLPIDGLVSQSWVKI